MCRRWLATSSVAAVPTVSSMATNVQRNRFRPVIGLEVHVQLNTRTKLFSRCPTSESSPNRRVLPFDMATPGTLPSLNRQCVLRALKMARLLNCHVPEWSRFDRKHYFYADMPAGYQITQNERPIAKDGRFGYWVFDENLDKPYWKEIEILKLQLEQDSGKMVHLTSSESPKSLVDYNRAGCALIEVVTSPCFSTAIEAIRFVQTLRLLIVHHNLSDGEMHKGHLRVDANVSLEKDGVEGTRTEIKNMNSIRTIHTAINFEIARQFEILKNDGGKVINETRAADSEGRTVPMRDKEVETDYRFMVEPNLPKLKIKNEWIEEVKKEMEMEGKADFEWLRDVVGFDARSAVHIAEEPKLLGFVKRCIRLKDPSVTADGMLYWMKELKTIMQRSKVNYPPQSDFFCRQFVTLIKLSDEHRLTRLRLLELLRFYALSDETEPIDDAVTLIEQNDFWRIVDAEQIANLVETVAKNEEKLVEKCRKGHAKSCNRLRNLIVDSTKKRIELDDLETALRRFLE